MKDKIQQFKKLTAKISYKPHGIFPSEMYLFYKLAYDFNEHDHIIESGSGLSTLYLSALFSKTKITSIDRHYGSLFTIRNRKNNLNLIRGDSSIMIPKLINNLNCNRIAILIDGPKGLLAVHLAKKVMSDSKVKFVAVHDLPDALAQMGKFNTRSHTYRNEYDYLDNDVGEYRTKHYPNGPGLTIFSKEEMLI